MLRLAIGVTLLVPVCFGETADLVITNARVYTADPAHPGASAIAVRGNKFVAVSEDVSQWIGPATKQIDAGGKTVVPGFIDAHGHMAALGANLASVDLRGIRSEQEIAVRVGEAAKGKKAGEWVQGHAWDQNLFPGQQFPTAHSLDQTAPENPVLLSRVDGHAVWVNTRVLQLAGITAATKDPAGGRIERDRDGKPTGVLVDRATSLVYRHVPGSAPEQLEENLRRAAALCSRLGLTGVHDAGIDAETLEAYRRLRAKNELPVRIYAMIAVPGSNALWDKYKARGPEIDPFLTVRSIKMLADGALGSRGAALLAPYTDDPGNTGLLILQPAFLEKAARDAVAAGFQANTHAIGDRANRVVLDAYAAALGGRNDKRFRVEHAQIVSPEDFARFREYSVIASMQPTHATSDMPWAGTRLGANRLRGAYAWKTFLKLDVPVAFGSDFPVEDPNPIWGFYAAITRQDHEGNPLGGWFPEQRFTRAQALRSWTAEGAYASFEEGRKGSIAPGKLADFVMLSANIMEAPPAEVWKTRVLMTVLDGRIVYQAP